MGLRGNASTSDDSKTALSTLRPFAPAPRHLASLVAADAFAG